MGQKLKLKLNDRPIEVEVEDSAAGPRVCIDGQWYAVDFEPTGRTGLYSLLVDGQSFEVYAEPRGAGWTILLGTRAYTVESDRRRGSSRAAAAEPEGVWMLRSPLTGIVTETLIAPGDAVRAGQVLLIVESMKINNELSAARGGSVAAVFVRPGDRVERGAPLVRVE